MKEKITSYQFLAIMFLVPYGTANLFFLIPEVKNDIWIALIFYAIISIFVQMIYITLFNKYPNDSIVTYLPKIFGKYIGFILSVIYIWYFIYIASRGLRDLIELTTSFGLIRMSVYIISSVFMITIVYGVYKGIENIGSMAQIAFIIVIFTSFVIFILLWITQNVIYYDNILPIMKENFISMILKSWKLSMFPYGEFIAMAMFYPFLMEKSKLKKTVISASIIEGIMLALNNALFIIAMGYEFAKSTNYPLLESLRLVRIGDFLNRLDVIFILVLIIGGFLKISVLIYAAVLGIEQIFNIKKWGLLCSILGVVVLITSRIMARDNAEHMRIGLGYVMLYIHLPAVLVIPLAAVIVYYLKKLIFCRRIEK